MLASSGSLTADDVSIRCTVRRSAIAAEHVFGEEQEMTCTMRNWKPSYNDAEEEHLRALQPGNNTLSPNVPHQGPELLLCPVHLPVRTLSANSYEPGVNGKSELPTERFHTFGSIPSLSVPNTIDLNDNRPHYSKTPNRGRKNSSGSNSSGTSRSSPSDHRPSSRKRGLLPHSMKASAAGMFATLDSSLHNNPVDMVASVQNLNFLKSYSIPLSDIMVVDVDGTNSGDYDETAQGGNRMGITTISNGYFDLAFATKNSHDVLMAFLRSSLPRERITMASTALIVPGRQLINNDSGNSSSLSRSIDSRSVDMDALTEKQIKQSVKTESMAQKMRRRMTRFIENWSEVSDCCVCGHFGNEEASRAITVSGNENDAKFSHRGTATVSPMELSYENTTYMTATPSLDSSCSQRRTYEPERVVRTLEVEDL